MDPAVRLIQGDAQIQVKNLNPGSIDLTVTSPPYFIGKRYDPSRLLDDFILFHKRIMPQIVEATRDGGSICWQVGYHVANDQLTPLDFMVHSIMSEISGVHLRGRIIWRFGHGLHATHRFSGRHETILWYTKGDKYHFNLDAVRVPQKYPGKRAYKGNRKGEYSGNPLGKNPEDVWDFGEDVWDIPNIKAGHVEKANHPCQFPVALPTRLIKALVPVGGSVLDPFMGSGSTGVAAILENRSFIGIEADSEYFSLAESRCNKAQNGTIRIRPDIPVSQPNPKDQVARRPKHFSDIEEFSGDSIIIN
jgi:adenine-specific DNA-methyltransferase